MICSNFLPLKSLEKTTNSLPKFIVNLNLVEFPLTLQFLYLIRTNKSQFQIAAQTFETVI